MLELLNNQLVFRFPEVHPECVLTVTLHRTLRIPDDGKSYPLPPSLGAFPMVHVDDYKDKVSPKWVGRGGVMIPMYQSEALWFSLHPGYVGDRGVPYPFAIKCATGKVSAITGKTWSKKLRADDYMVAPGQPWLDGYVVADGTIKQFVAAPLGLGVTAEGQITGKEEFGGLQLEVLPMLLEKFNQKFPRKQFEVKTRGVLRSHGLTGPTGPQGPLGAQGPVGPAGLYNNISECSLKVGGSSVNYSSDQIKVISHHMVQPVRNRKDYAGEVECSAMAPSMNTMFSMDLDREREVDDMKGGEAPNIQLDMGLAAGGRMDQQVFKDPHGIECWDSQHKIRVFIHMANSIGWQHVTGSLPPHPPLSAKQYTDKGYPWFSYYEEGVKSQAGTEALKGLKSLAELQEEKKIPLLPENQSVKVPKKQTNQVRDGVWK
jgi:hypothetical protein